MKQTLLILALFSLSFFTNRYNSLSLANSEFAFHQDAQKQIANDIAENLSKKQYENVQKEFANGLKSQLTPDMIGKGWENLLSQAGDFVKILSTTSTTIRNFPVVKVRCQFKNDNANIEVTFNDDNKVIGLFLKP